MLGYQVSLKSWPVMACDWRHQKICLAEVALVEARQLQKPDVHLEFFFDMIKNIRHAQLRETLLGQGQQSVPVEE